MDEKTTTIHTTEVLSSSKIVELIDEFPNLSKITCAPSVYEKISKSYIDALKQLDIEVEKKYNWGAKSQSNGLEFEVEKLAIEGFKAREISEMLDISLNRVYYLIRKTDSKFNNYKRKHDYEKVTALKNKGLSAGEIALKLDIPLRSVYYILNKK